MATHADEFVYRIAGVVRGARPGHHRSPGGDQGLEFRGHARLSDAPDARRLDLRASLRDPLALEAGQWLVRQHAQRKAIDVSLLADLSLSMLDGGDAGAGAGGAPNPGAGRREVLARLAEALAWSAWRLGDRFGFVGCDEAVLATPRLPPSRAQGLGPVLAQALRQHRPAPGRGRSAQGLLQGAAALGARRGLVFLVSDFHWPDALLQQLLAALALHDVVPVVLWQADEFQPGAAQGLAALREPEGRGQRLLWWRPALRAQAAAAGVARRAALTAAFRARQLTPLFLEGPFDGQALARHFAR